MGFNVFIIVFGQMKKFYGNELTLWVSYSISIKM